MLKFAQRQGHLILAAFPLRIERKFVHLKQHRVGFPMSRLSAGLTFMRMHKLQLRCLALK